MKLTKKLIQNIVFGAGIGMLFMTGCGDDGPTQYELGAAALEDGSYEQAVGAFELSIAEEKDVLESYRGEGIAYLKMGEYEEASASFEKALSILEEERGNKELEIDILSYQASAFYKNQDLDAAKACCDQILELDFSRNAYFMRGQIYLDQDLYEDARRDFSNMLQESQSYEDYMNVYRVYAEKDMTADGDSFLEEALEIPYKDEDDLFERGRIYYFLEDYESAKTELIEAMNEGQKEAALFLGKVYVELNDIGNARIMYQQYMTDNGESAKSYNGLAYCDIAEGNYDSALNNITLGLTLAADDERQSLLFNEIVAYEGKLDFETAKAKAEAYLQLYPNDTAAQRELEFLQTR